MSDQEVDEGQIEKAQSRHIQAFLKTAILFGAAAGGAAITVSALVRRHRVSAGAARDALMKLEDEGLVGRESPDSAVVSDPAHERPGK